MATDFEKLSALVVADPLPMKMLLIPSLDTIGVKTIITTGSAKDAFDLFCKYSPDIVLVDRDMARPDGMDLIKKIRRDQFSPNHRAPVILLTGDETAQIQMNQARDAGVTGLLLKPFSASDLIKHITHAMKDSREFIDLPTYAGPDRRRKTLLTYEGPFRRATDG